MPVLALRDASDWLVDATRLEFDPTAVGGGSGTVTQINAGSGITLTPNPITGTGSIAVDTAVVVPVTRLINTTSPLAGGGDLSTDRTLSIAITPANNGGAVALQAATPGTQQTGHFNVSGWGLMGKGLVGPDYGGFGDFMVNRADGLNNTYLEVHNPTSSLSAKIQVFGELGRGVIAATGSAAGGTGYWQNNRFVIHADSSMSSGLCVGTDAASPISLYTGGQAAANERVRVTSSGKVSINDQGTISALGDTYDATVTISRNATAPPGLTLNLVGTALHLVGIDSGPNRLVFDCFSSFNSLVFRHAGGSASAPSMTTSGSIMGSVGATGYSSSGSYPPLAGSAIIFYATGNWQGGVSYPSDIRLYTTSGLTSSEVARFTDSGNFLVGTTTDTGSKIVSNGMIEVSTSSPGGSGIKFRDGSIQTTAITGGVPTTRLINTTLPLAGGGDLSADRTLSISITPANNGGAVALQTVFPGSSQSGFVSVTAATSNPSMFGGGLMVGSYGLGYLLQVNAAVSGDAGAGLYNSTSSTTATTLLDLQSTTAHALLSLQSTAYTGTGARQANSVALIADTNATNGISIASQAAAPIRFYTNGIAAGNQRLGIASDGKTTITTSGTWNNGLYPLTVSKNAAAPRSFSVLAEEPIIHVVGTDSTSPRILIDACGTNLYTPGIACRQTGGTNASPSATPSNVDICGLEGYGYGTSGYSSGWRAGFWGVSTESWTDAAQGALCQFYATKTGALTGNYHALTDSSLLLGQNSVAVATDMSIIGQSITAFTYTNVAGGKMTYKTGLGSGTGTPASHTFTVPLGVASGTNPQTYQDVLVINGSLASTPAVINTANGAWVQLAASRKRNTGDVTNATTTFSNLSDFSITVINGRKYSGRYVFICNDSVAAEGIKFDFNGGAATMTSFEAYAMASASTAPTIGALEATTLAGVINYTSMGITGNVMVIIEVAFVASATGTVIPRFAQNSHATGTATVKANSFCQVDDSAN